MNKRRKFSAEFKAKVVLTALSERQSLSEIAQQYDVHPNMISQWKKEFLSKAANVFESDARLPDKDEKERQKLYEKIGQQQVELDFLKKASAILNR
jgi:transposase